MLWLRKLESSSDNLMGVRPMPPTPEEGGKAQKEITLRFVFASGAAVDWRS